MWLLVVSAMGNSNSQAALPRCSSDGSNLLRTQVINKNVAAGDSIKHAKDPRSPSAGIPRNSFRSRLLSRNGEPLVHV